MSTGRRAHWQQVYATRTTDRLGWYKPHLETSLDWIASLGLTEDAPMIDIGCGASTLVDDLLEAGYGSITALDISENALAAAHGRLGEQADRVVWINGDITEAGLPEAAYDLWHDRAVFHFLTDAEDRRAYRDRLLASLRRDGHLIIGTFAPEAPPKCSGLPVERYDVDGLVEALEPGFELIEHKKEMHITPGGVEQMYQYCLFRRALPE